MYLARNIHADHKDLIHDVAYDFYGRRLATCSSDQSVKVWDLGEDGQWRCTSSWKTHSSSVWKVTWAHPEFGQIIATCSFDRTAAIWEEMIADNNNGERNQSVWIRRSNFVDSRTSVTDVKFAPKHYGLLLATCSSDGIVRIYEAPDIMNISQWSVQHEIVCSKSCSSITWNSSLTRIRSPMIAVGSDDTNATAGNRVLLYEFNENTRRWTKVENVCHVSDAVHDIAFAPNVGKSYDLLGVATSKDVKIISIHPLETPHDTSLLHISTPQILQTSLSQNSPKFDIRIIALFEDHGAQVWRVSWNITGTILASSGDDGTVRLWKANYLEKWKNVGTLKADTHSTMTNGASTGETSDGKGQSNKYFKLTTIAQSNHIPWH